MPHAEGCNTFTLEHMKKEAPKVSTTTCCTTVEKEDPCADPCGNGLGYGRRVGYFFVWLIVIWIIVAAILWIFQPDFLFNGFDCGKRRKRCERSRSCSRDGDDCLNFGHLFLWSLGIALVIVFLIWLFRAYGSRY